MKYLLLLYSCLLFIIILYILFFINNNRNIENLESNNNTIELVVSRYNEDLEWLNNEEYFQNIPVTIYNKNEENNENFYKPNNVKHIIPLENVGVCNHTYLYHIINNYDNLANVTIFLPGSCMDAHKKEKTLQTIQKTKETKNSVFLVSYYNKGVLNTLYDFIIDNYVVANSKNYELNKSDKLKQCSIRPFGKWYETVFPNININHVNYQSIFSVSREHILNRSKESYQEILNYVNTYKNEESAHYIERTFLAIFYPIPDKCLFLFKSQRNTGELFNEE